MTNMLERARTALGERNEYDGPGKFEHVAPTKPPFQLFTVPREPEVDPSDIDAAITNELSKGPTALTEEKSYTDNLRQSMIDHRSSLETDRATFEDQRAKINEAHKSDIDQLNDQIRTRNEANAEANGDIDNKIADINLAISGATAAIDVLPLSFPAPTGSPPSLNAVRAAREAGVKPSPAVNDKI